MLLKKKKTGIKRIFTYFYVFFMIVGMYLIFNPNTIVSAASSSTGFEDGTLNQPYSNAWMYTEQDMRYSDCVQFEVDNDYVAEGAKSFKAYSVKQPCDPVRGWWNYTTVSSSNYIYSWSSQILCVSTYQATISFYLQDDTEYDLPVIQLSIGEIDDCWKYLDHNSQKQIIYDQNELSSGDWYEVGWRIIDNDTILYYVMNNETMTTDDYVTGSPRVTDWNLGVDYIDSMRIIVSVASTGTRALYFDTHNISMGEAEPPGGNLTFNVYNESDPSVAIPNWTMTIYDEYGFIYYSHDYLNNPLVVETDNITTGDLFFDIGADGYDNRTYYADVEGGVLYDVNAFLPQENETNFYVIEAVDSQGTPVYNVEIHITKSINGSLQEVTSGFTSAGGAIGAYLIEDSVHYINLTHDDYEPLILQSFITSSEEYGTDHPIIFIMQAISYYYLNETAWHEEIDFTYEIANYNLYVNYTDHLENTSDTNIIIYEINNDTGVITQYDTSSESGVDSWTYNIAIDDKNCYWIILHVNHTNFGYIIDDDNFVCGGNQTYVNITSKTTFDDLFDINFGYNPFGWSNTFGFFLMCASLFSFGEVYSGVGVILTGFLLLFINVVIGLTLISVVAPTLFILLGILVIWGTHRRVAG